jgi:hypothetical protein
LSWLELAMRESKSLGDGTTAETGETLTSREDGLRPCQSTAGVITEASMVPPNPNGVATKNLPNYLGWRRALEAWGDQLAPPNWIQGAIGNGPYQQLTL